MRLIGAGQSLFSGGCDESMVLIVTVALRLVTSVLIDLSFAFGASNYTVIE